MSNTVDVRPNAETLLTLENTIRKHLLKEDRHDRSYEWNRGFNDCCKFILDEIKLHGGKPDANAV